MKIKVVKIEDLVGLKVLAYANNSDREERDKADIKLIIDAINNKQIQINIDKIVTYYEMFDRMADYNKYWNKDQ